MSGVSNPDAAETAGGGNFRSISQYVAERIAVIGLFGLTDAQESLLFCADMPSQRIWTLLAVAEAVISTAMRAT